MYFNYIENELTIYYNTIKNTKIKEILVYSLEGGKCIRGFIVKHLIETLTQSNITLWEPIVAIELVHGISLIIDDLPCMDNDRIRRNKDSTFVKFGEKQTILISYYVISEVFGMLVEAIDKLNFTNDEYVINIKKLIKTWREYIGKNLIIGQLLDLEENVKELLDLDIDLNNININIINYKTGSLFIFAFLLGGIYSNKQINLEDYKQIGIYFGLMYQITDDSRDIAKDKKEINIVLNIGQKKTKLLYLECKTKLLDLLDKNNIATKELLELIYYIDSLLLL
jgi:farnesyl diphosphate synthase